MVTAEEGDGDRHGCWRRRASGVVVVVCGVAVTLATGVAEQHHHHQWGWVPPIPITMTTAESSSTGVVAARRTHHRPARRRRILPENTTTHSRAPRLSLPSNKRRKRRRRMTPRGDLVGSHTATDPHCRHPSNEEEKCIVIVRFDESAILKRSWVNHTTDTNSSDSLVPRNEVTAAAVQQMAVELAGWIPGARILFMYQHAFLGVALTHVSYRRVTEALLLLHTMTTTTTTTSLNATSSSRNSGSISSGIHSVRQNQLLSLDEITEPTDELLFELDENATVWDTTTIGVTPTTSAQDPLLRSDNWKNETEFVIQSGDTLSAGLDRIDQSDLPLDGQYKYRWDGTGVTVFVMDTGLRMSHDEFQDRAVPPICGFDAYRNKEPDNPSCYDNHNHGTHVAGIVGGRTAGVAKNATLVAVKVIGKYGFGSDATIYAGLDYILGQKRARPKEPMVANLSLSAALDVRYNRLITKLVEAGVVVVVAAGNRRTRACLFSPSSACQAITVGASVYSSRFQRDRRAGFSNHGRCVDIFAPGVLIPSASARSDTAYARKSGTSMAAPHVAGAAALYLHRHPSWTPSQVQQALLSDATSGQMLWIFNRLSHNKLLYTGNI